MPASPTAWVIVTGAAGAIGQGLCRHYVAQGRKVLALDRQADTPQSGTMPVSASVDLADPDAVEEVLGKTIPRGEPIALLVNAAGLIWSEPVLSVAGTKFTVHDIATWERVLRANLTTAFVAGSRVAARMARSGGGCIVNFSSISASGNAGQAAYAAAKAGIEGLTRAMAQELGPLRIRVNALAPGFIDVSSTHAALTASVIEDYTRRTPLRRLGHIDDVVEAVDMLERNAFITGSVVELDGGLRL
jgi:3-oxoacyl-[acyl-carrier protein] reductase